VYRIVGTVTGQPGDVLAIDGEVTHGEPDSEAANDYDDAQILIVGAPTPTPTPTPPTPSPPDEVSPSPSPSPSPPGQFSASPSSGRARPSRPLPRTGLEVAALVIAGLASITLGAALLRLRRRRAA
jgi:LPXTG-motif cell wall-anchored protein